MATRRAVTLCLVPFLALGCEAHEDTPPAAAPPAVTSTAAAPIREEPPLGRLPKDVRPTRYKVALEVAPARDRFAGTVDIDVTLQRARDVVWMHAKDITAREVVVRPAS